MRRPAMRASTLRRVWPESRALVGKPMPSASTIQAIVDSAHRHAMASRRDMHDSTSTMSDSFIARCEHR
jgi:hypothetical protein